MFNSKLVEMDNSSLVTGKKHFNPLETATRESDWSGRGGGGFQDRGNLDLCHYGCCKVVFMNNKV